MPTPFTHDVVRTAVRDVMRVGRTFHADRNHRRRHDRLDDGEAMGGRGPRRSSLPRGIPTSWRRSSPGWADRYRLEPPLTQRRSEKWSCSRCRSGRAEAGRGAGSVAGRKDRDRHRQRVRATGRCRRARGDATPGGSAAWAATLFPDARWVKAFNTVYFKVLERKRIGRATESGFRWPVTTAGRRGSRAWCAMPGSSRFWSVRWRAGRSSSRTRRLITPGKADRAPAAVHSAITAAAGP